MTPPPLLADLLMACTGVCRKTIQHPAGLAKTVEMGCAGLPHTPTQVQQTMTQIRADMQQGLRDLSARLDRQETTVPQEIREVRTVNQRQRWAMMTMVLVTMVGGMITIVFFTPARFSLFHVCQESS